LDAVENEERWGREQISVWLSARRKAQLRQIAAQLPSGATPADALDRALDLATMPIFAPLPGAGDDLNPADEPSHVARLEAKLLAAIEMNREKASEVAQRIERRLDAMGSRVERIDSRMSAALGEDSENHAAFDSSESAVPAIDEWLRQQQKLIGSAVEKSALVRADWRAKTRVVDGILAFDLHCELVAIDSARVLSPPSPSLARVQILTSDRPLSQLDSVGEILLSCEAWGGGRWKISVYPINPDEKIGASIGSFKC